MSNYFSPESSSLREEEISTLLGKDILESSHIKRLRGVSFQGVMNFSLMIPEELWFNRFDHSISVAYLNYHFCKNLDIPEEAMLVSTLACLLHDISHPSFSHSTEIFMGIRSGDGRTHQSVVTPLIIKSALLQGYSTFPTKLKNFDPIILANLINQLLTNSNKREKYDPNLICFIETPFCADTFDGVNRAWYVIKNKLVWPNNLEIMGDNLNTFESLNPLDPLKLIKFISSSDKPYIIRSPHGPTPANLIRKFHDLMRILYNDIIYTDWQTSAMIMFARAEEIAFKDLKSIRQTYLKDNEVLGKIDKNPLAAKVFAQIKERKPILTLSKEKPLLFKEATEYYLNLKQKGNSYREIKYAIEIYISKALNIQPNFVFWHRQRKLIWSSENVFFKSIQEQKGLHDWLLVWDQTEGKPEEQPVYEVYYFI